MPGLLQKEQDWFHQRFDSVMVTIASLMDGSASRHRDNGDLFRRILSRIDDLEKNIMATLDDVIAELKNNSNLSNSVVTALGAQRDQIAALIKSQGIDPASQAKIDQILGDLQKNDQSVAAAVLANTSAEAGSSGSATVKNDGPTDAQQSGGSSGTVPATQGSDTSGTKGPGADQEPAPASDSAAKDKSAS